MVKILSQAFGGDNKSDTIKVNDMKSPEAAVTSLNKFFGA